jgi:hypothetical protein
MRYVRRCCIFGVLALSIDPAMAADPSHPACENPAPAISPRATLENRLTGEAKQALLNAKGAVAAEDWAVAVREYQHAYDVSRDGGIQWNIAAAEEKRGNLFEAWQAMGRYLDSHDAYDLEAACGFLVSLRGRLSELTLRVSEADALISVDESPKGKSPITEPILANPGTRTIRVEKRGFVPKVVLAALGSGLSTTVDIVLVPGESALSPVAPQILLSPSVTEAPTPAFPPSAIQESASAALPWEWIGLGAAVLAGGIVGTYFLVRPDGDRTAPPVAGSFDTVQLPLVW